MVIGTCLDAAKDLCALENDRDATNRCPVLLCIFVIWWRFLAPWCKFSRAGECNQLGWFRKLFRTKCQIRVGSQLRGNWTERNEIDPRLGDETKGRQAGGDWRTREDKSPVWPQPNVESCLYGWKDYGWTPDCCAPVCASVHPCAGLCVWGSGLAGRIGGTVMRTKFN